MLQKPSTKLYMLCQGMLTPPHPDPAKSVHLELKVFQMTQMSLGNPPSDGTDDSLLGKQKWRPAYPSFL